MTASYLELYQERAKDLLGDPKKKESLEVRTHPVYGVFVPGLTEFPLTSEEDVKRLLKSAAQPLILLAHSHHRNPPAIICFLQQQRYLVEL